MKKISDPCVPAQSEEEEPAGAGLRPGMTAGEEQEEAQELQGPARGAGAAPELRAPPTLYNPAGFPPG